MLSAHAIVLQHAPVHVHVRVATPQGVRRHNNSLAAIHRCSTTSRDMKRVFQRQLSASLQPWLSGLACSTNYRLCNDAACAAGERSSGTPAHLVPVLAAARLLDGLRRVGHAAHHLGDSHPHAHHRQHSSPQHACRVCRQSTLASSQKWTSICALWLLLRAQG